MANWTNRHRGDYVRMIKRHRALWAYITQFIKDHDITSVIEVGCGMVPEVRGLVETYVGVDLNEQTDAIHEDFTLMDVSPLTGYDLFLACAVIEHCQDAAVFFKQIKAMNPKHAIVTFFGATDREEELKTTQGGGFLFHGYTRAGIKQTLESLGMAYELFRLKNDDVLIIKGE